MASAVQEVWRLRSCRAASTGLTVPMILDSGDAARVAAIDKFAGAKSTTPFLDAKEWAALKRICEKRLNDLAKKQSDESNAALIGAM